MEPTERPPLATRDTWLMAGLGLAGLVLIAGFASYLHALNVVQAADGHHLVAWFIPALADLLILTAGANVLDAVRSGAGWPWVSLVAVIVGVLVTLGLNVATSNPHEVPKWLVNGWPPVAFLLGAESFMGLIRRGRASPFPEIHGGGPATPGHCPHQVALTRDGAIRAAFEHARDCLDDPLSQRQLAASFGLHRDKVAALVKDPPAGTAPEPPHAVPAGAVPPSVPSRHGEQAAALNGQAASG